MGTFVIRSTSLDNARVVPQGMSESQWTEDMQGSLQRVGRSSIPASSESIRAFDDTRQNPFPYFQAFLSFTIWFLVFFIFGS